MNEDRDSRRFQMEVWENGFGRAERFHQRPHPAAGREEPRSVFHQYATIVLVLVVAIALAPTGFVLATSFGIECGKTIRGTIDPVGGNLTDTYSFTAEGGETVAITTPNVGSNVPDVAEPCWELLTPPPVESLAGVCRGQAEVQLPQRGGVYTILVFDDGDDEAGEYSVTLEAVSGRFDGQSNGPPDPICGRADVDGNPDPDDGTQAIGCGETKVGDFEVVGETDTYSFTAEGGETVAITTPNVGSNVSGVAEPCWQLFGPDGARVGEPVCRGRELRPLEQAGIYTIKVFDDGHDEPGQYTVDLSFIGPCPCGDGLLCPGEECDEGSDNGMVGSCCTWDCQLLPAEETCRPAVGDCDVAEFCDRAKGGCPPDVLEPPDTPCGDPSATQCDNRDTCDGAGTCQPNYEPPTTTCQDGLFCTSTSGAPGGADNCDGGGSCAGGAVNCDDGLFCTGTESCNEVTDQCDSSGDPCPGTECNMCQEATDSCLDPAGTACGEKSSTQCDDPDTCDGEGTCEPNYKPSTTICNDGLFCTSTSGAPAGADNCDGAGNCVGDPVSCDDGLFCNGTESCNEVTDKCDPGELPCPPSGTECNTCQEAADSCFDPPGTPCGDPSARECDNADTCNGEGECLPNYEPPTTTCQDGQFCTSTSGMPGGVDNCSGAGSCVGDPVSCDDGLFCNGTESCNEVTDKCDSSGDPCPGTECNMCQEATDSCFDPPDTLCDDEEFCTDPDKCDGAGECTGPPRDCSDGNVCTEDSCEEDADRCVSTVVLGRACDELTCMDDETCQIDATCGGGTQIVCEVGPCETGECREPGGCVTTPANEGEPCDDRNLCTEGDECHNGECVGTERDCDDGNPCTEDYCDESGNCSYEPSPNEMPCDNGNDVHPDMCVDGKCVDATCEGKKDDAGCDDGNACTDDDECNQDGQCKGSEECRVELPSCAVQGSGICVIVAACTGKCKVVIALKITGRPKSRCKAVLFGHAGNAESTLVGGAFAQKVVGAESRTRCTAKTQRLSRKTTGKIDKNGELELDLKLNRRAQKLLKQCGGLTMEAEVTIKEPKKDGGAKRVLKRMVSLVQGG